MGDFRGRIEPSWRALTVHFTLESNVGDHFNDISLTRSSDSSWLAQKLRPWNRFQTRLLAGIVVLSIGTSAIAGYTAFRREMRLARAAQQRHGRLLAQSLAYQSAWPLSANFSVDTSPHGSPTDAAQSALHQLMARTLAMPNIVGVTLYNTRAGQIAPHDKTNPALGPSTAMIHSLLADPHKEAYEVRAGEHLHFLCLIRAPRRSPGSRGRKLGVAHVALSLRPASERLSGALNSSLKASALILLLGVIVALFLSRRLSRPVLALVHGAEKLRAGELGYQLKVQRRDELGLLAHSFNRMSSQLLETVTSLNHLNQHLEAEISKQTLGLRRSRDFIALLNVPLQLHKLLDTALDALIRSSGAMAGAIYLRERRRLELVVSQGALARVFALDEQEAAFIGEQTAKHAMVLRDQALSAQLTAEFPRAGAVLYDGIIFRERLEGTLVLVFDEHPSADRVVFVEQASSQLAIALVNTQALANAEHLTRELEQRNIALLQRRDQLQEMNRLKSEFLARVSHELRTPLNAILGYTELLTDGIYGEVTARQEQRLGGIEESATNLLELINQILDLSRVEAGRMAVHLEEINPVELVREVVELAAALVRECPYELEMVAPEAPIALSTDPTKVRQILVNMLSNAIKFTTDGGVRVGVESHKENVCIWVEDTGIGIEHADLALIFDEFRQVDGSTTRRHGGSGLGLAISRKLAALIGASIKVESHLGKGSTFTLVLPFSPVPQRIHPAEGLPEISIKVAAHPLLENEESIP
ncbi:MAG: HAMP domain-containing protein [Deltaproteobacteria bacterium]|nr:HAMP domain-containing protein [Deltaproteobacteria bacterium]